MTPMILTDEHFFGGHLDHLRQIRAAVQLPLLVEQHRPRPDGGLPGHVPRHAHLVDQQPRRAPHQGPDGQGAPHLRAQDLGAKPPRPPGPVAPAGRRARGADADPQLAVPSARLADGIAATEAGSARHRPRAGPLRRRAVVRLGQLPLLARRDRRPGRAAGRAAAHRNLLHLALFWISGVMVAVLTIVSSVCGVLSVKYAIEQRDLALAQFRLALAAGCADDRLAAKMPEFCLVQKSGPG